MKLKTQRRYFRILACLIPAIMICLILPVNSPAVSASPETYEIVQPDGNVFIARTRGDEWNNWVETADGYSVAQDEKGFWNYIDFYEGSAPVPSGIYAHESPPFGTEKHLIKTDNFMRMAPSAESMDSAPAFAPPPGPFTGPVLFILVEFTDRLGTYTETDFASFVSNDIANYFNVASYGNVTLNPAAETSGTSNNGVIGWVNVGYAHPDTRNAVDTRNRQLAKDAIIAADPFINYLSYDTNPTDGYVDAHELAVVVIAAGFERSFSSSFTPNVWGHKWSVGDPGNPTITPPQVDTVYVGAYHNDAGGYAQFGETHQSSSFIAHQATMGIMVHELGHLILGLPDLYDTDGSSEGIGNFGLMGAGSWGNASTDLYPGETPTLPCAWTKYDRGWVTAPVGGNSELITAAGAAGANSSNSAFRVLTNDPNEYFLVENRQALGYDKGFERFFGAGFAGGLAIWHIDDSTIAANMSTNSVNNSECTTGPGCAGTSNHYGVALEQADGFWHLESGLNRGNVDDLWHNASTTFCSGTTPNSDKWNTTPSGAGIVNIGLPATVMTADLLLPAPSAPSVLTATALSSSRIDLNWTDSALCEDEFKIERKIGIGGAFTEIATVGLNISTYSNTGLSGSTEYYYQVRARNLAGNSAYSNQANATTSAGGGGGGGGRSSDGGGDGGGGGGCFIATAAYGSYMADEVMVLRQFRDTYLMNNYYGRAFVSAYYKYSPPIADIIKDNELLKTVTRIFLTPVVLSIVYPYQSLAIFIALLFAASTLQVRRKKG